MLVEIRPLTVEEYRRLGEAGILSSDENVELIEGQIYKKTVKGASHSAATKRVEKLLERRLGERVLVRLQDPIRLNDYSEPEPDIAVVMPDPLYYEDRHPITSEIYLILEIADSSLARDTEFKVNTYARAGITDYWVLDLTKRQLYVFREPTLEGYQSQTVLSEDEEVFLLAFPDVAIAVGEMLCPKFLCISL